MIEVLALSRRYGLVEAVRNVTFSIGSGEVVGLLGPNGAGKTTIMKILTCSLFPTSGTARVAGYDVVEDPLAVKRAVGYLPENAPLYGDLTVAEYLRFIADSRGLTRAERSARLEQVSADCGLTEVLHRRIDELSRGYRQRTGLAQALLHDPPLLILDEPTAGLDPHQIVEIRELIRRLGREKTVILSSHIMQEVEATCQRVLILKEGSIVAQGTREEIERRVRGQAFVDVTLRVPAGTTIDTRALASAAGIMKVVSQSRDAKGDTVIGLSVTPGSAVETDVFDWAVASGVKIVSMVPRRLSLEDIFISLTEREAEP